MLSYETAGSPADQPFIFLHALALSSPRDDLHPESVASTIANSLPNSQLTSLPPRHQEPEAYQ